jgi:hypothetical protein
MPSTRAGLLDITRVADSPDTFAQVNASEDWWSGAGSNYRPSASQELVRSKVRAFNARRAPRVPPSGPSPRVKELAASL